MKTLSYFLRTISLTHALTRSQTAGYLSGLGTSNRLVRHTFASDSMYTDRGGGQLHCLSAHALFPFRYSKRMTLHTVDFPRDIRAEGRLLLSKTCLFEEFFSLANMYDSARLFFQNVWGCKILLFRG